MKIHEAVQHFRLAKSMTIADLARELGVDRATVYRLEKPECNPSIRRLFNLNKILGMGMHFSDAIIGCQESHKCKPLEL